MEINDLLSEGPNAYYRVTNSAGKEWLFPVQGLKTALGLYPEYQPRRASGMWMRRLLPLVHSHPKVRERLGITQVHGRLIEPVRNVIADFVGVQDFDVAFFGGTPSVHKKVTIQITRDGKYLGYCKATDRPDIIDLFRNEKQVLDSLEAVGMTHVPRCSIVETDGITLFLHTTEKTVASREVCGFSSDHQRFLDRLESLTETQMPLHDTGLWHHIEQARPLIANLSPERREVIEHHISQIEKKMGTGLIRAVTVHEDFVPWNVLRNPDSTIFVFDWEYAVRHSIPGIDRIHYDLQPAIMERRKSLRQLIAMCRYFDPVALRCYLVDSYCRFLVRENGRPPHCMARTLDLWLDLLNNLYY